MFLSSSSIGLIQQIFFFHCLSSVKTSANRCSAATALFAACGESSQPTVDVLNVWGGEEQDSFKAVVAPFSKSTNIAVNVEATRDLDATLTSRIRGNNPPDIAILPNPGKMQQLASQNKLIRLDKFLNMSKLRSNYASSWIDRYSHIKWWSHRPPPSEVAHEVF